MATKKQLDDAIKKLKEPQKSAVKAVVAQAEATDKALSSNELTYILNNISSITESTDPKKFLGTSAQRVEANKKGGTVAGYTATPATDVKTKDEWAIEYGTQAALVNSNKELKDLFNKAVAEKWTPDKFNSAFINTTWYKSNSDTWRTAESTRLTDPASWEEQIGLARDLIERSANDLGFRLSDSQVNALAKQSLYLAGGTSNAINLATLKTHIAETGRITGEGGSTLKTMDELKAVAYENGISYNDAWYTGAVKDIFTGTGTVEEWNKQIKDAAKSKYAALAPMIDKGMTVRAIASPYLEAMATTFEVDPTSASLDDPLMQKALTNLNQGNEPSLKPLWQFERELKQDDRYFKTNKANQEMTGLATEIARQFGKM